MKRCTALLAVVLCAACGGDDEGASVDVTYVFDRSETRKVLARWEMDAALLDQLLREWNARLLLRADATFVLDFVSRDDRRERTAGTWSRSGDRITLHVSSRGGRKLQTPHTSHATVDGDLLRLHTYEKDQYELVLRKR